MSDRQFERTVIDWLEDGTDRTPERAIDGVLLAVKTTPQERDLRIPWRLPRMLALPRASGIAAVALVAVVGVGGLIFLGNRAAPGGTGGQPTSPPATVAPTTAPTASPTPRPTPAPTSEAIDGALEPTSEWTPFTSTVYGYTMAYPAGWEAGPASRAWQQGDDLGLPTADEFVRPDNELGYAVWQMPAGEDADIESVDGLTAWAEAFCNDNRVSGCDTLAERTVPMCLDAGGDTCRAAIRVRSEGTNPEDEAEYAFFPGWASVMLTEAPDKVTVVMTGRGDAWAGAAEYGGVVELLESILSTMGVTPR